MLFILIPEAFPSLKSESVCHSVVSNSLRPMELACQSPLSMEFPRQEYFRKYPSLNILPKPVVLHPPKGGLFRSLPVKGAHFSVQMLPLPGSLL